MTVSDNKVQEMAGLPAPLPPNSAEILAFGFSINPAINQTE
jgi:hypothetical protein